MGPPKGHSGLSVPSQSLSHGSSPLRGSRSRPSCTGAAARISTPTTMCPGKYTSARRWGAGAGLGPGWYGDKGGFLLSPRPCRVTPRGSPSWQVFYPKDSINNPLLLDLIFRQVRCTSGLKVTWGSPGSWGIPSPQLGVGSARCSPHMASLLLTPFPRSSTTHSPTPASGSARRSGSA